jgi:hypothetical protein
LHSEAAEIESQEPILLSPYDFNPKPRFHMFSLSKFDLSMQIFSTIKIEHHLTTGEQASLAPKL